MQAVMVKLSVEKTEEGGRWAAYLPELGAFVHGESEQELAERVEQAVQLLGSHFADIDALLSFLDSRAVAHWVVEDPVPTHLLQARRTSTETRVLKVLAGASAR